VLGAAVWGVMRLTYGVDEEVILLGKLTRSWRAIEVTLQRMAPIEIRNQNTQEVIDYLYEQRYLSAGLRDRLQELRKQRNENVHKMTNRELASLVDEVQAVESTLRVRFLRR